MEQRAGMTLVAQVYPASIVHVLLQPSPSIVLPSSHPSVPTVCPSPHIEVHTPVVDEQ